MNLTMIALRQSIGRALRLPGAPPTPGYSMITQRPEQSKPAGLVTDFAIEQFANLLMRVPDPDDVLRRAGLHRHDLRRLELDDEISGAIETRREAVLLTTWRIESPSESPQDAFVRAEVAKVADTFLRGAWDAVPYGYAVSEAIYAQRDGVAGIGAAVGIDRMSVKPMQWFEPMRDGRLLMNRPGYAERVELDTEHKFCLTRRSATYENPYGEALLSRLYWPWFFRQHSWRAWMQFVERFGDPFVVGHSQQPTELVAALLGMGVKNIIGVSADDKIEVIHPTGAETFEKLDARLTERIQKTILGQTLTSGAGGGKGSYALGKVHDQVRTDKRLADGKMLQGSMQWLVNSLWALNEFPGPVPQFLFFDPADIAVERSQRDVDLAGAGIVSFRKTYLLKAYGFEDGDIDIPPPGKVQPLGKVPSAGRGAPDVAGLAELATRAEHAPRPRGRRDFTPAQQAVEALGDAAMASAPADPIPLADMRAAIIGAADQADLEVRLAALFDRTDARFADTLARAMFAADVLGYVHADEGA